MKKHWYMALLLLLFSAVLIAPRFSVQAKKQAAGGYFVKVAAAEQANFADLDLDPLLAYDYQTFYWYELSEADYTALVESQLPFTAVANANTVQIVTYQFDPVLDGEPAIAPALQADPNQPGFYLVQFNGPIQSDWLSQLEAAGLPTLQYYPHNAYLTWGTAVTLAQTESLSFVRWHGAVHPAYKADPYLQTLNGRIENVDILFYNDGHIEATLDAIEARGGQVLQHHPAQPDKAFYNAIVQIDANGLNSLAGINTVLWMGHLSPTPQLDDEISSQIVAGNHPGGVPVVGYQDYLTDIDLDGSGVTWAIIDTGVDYDHPDLLPNIVGGYSFPGTCFAHPGDDCSGGGHGTHVAGIIGGTGVGDAGGPYTDSNGFLYGLGVAPGYGIFAMNSLMGAAWPPTGGWQEHSKQAVLGNAIGGNNSWHTGEGTAHGYQASERTHDFLVRDGNFDTTTVAEPFIEVFSAGNSGSGSYTLTAPKEAKNLIVVASSVNYRAGSIESISGFSSRGPAVDGRWVPTIAAPGQQIASTRNNAGGSCSTPISGTNNLYAYCSGTSMAAPQVSGVAAIYTEWWRNNNGGADPSPAMVKALLVNGAVDMTNVPAIPNNAEGWGRVNITNIVDPEVPFVFYDQTELFSETGDQLELTVFVADTSKPVKITLAWTDAPGAAGANPALVNNLNLTVEDGSDTYLGNVFNNSWSVTGGSVDNINNLENVYIQNAGSVLHITIDAASIAGDGVPYNGDTTDQDFALVCQNCIEQFVPIYSVDLTAVDDALSAAAGQTVTYTLNLENSGNMTDTYDVAASGFAWSTAVEPANVTLLPNETTAVTVTVAIPDDALGADSDLATISATSQTDASVIATADLTTSVDVFYGVTLTAVDEALSAAAGETVTYTLSLTNSGNITDSYDLSLAGFVWPTAVDPSSVTLAANESTAVTVTVAIPDDAVVDSTDVVTVTAVSQADSSVSADLALTTAVEQTIFFIYLPAVLKP